MPATVPLEGFSGPEFFVLDGLSLRATEVNVVGHDEALAPPLRTFGGALVVAGTVFVAML